MIYIQIAMIIYNLLPFCYSENTSAVTWQLKSPFLARLGPVGPVYIGLSTPSFIFATGLSVLDVPENDLCFSTSYLGIKALNK